MTRNRAEWWKRAAQSLPRAGLLWLALTAVTLGSLVSSGTGLAPNGRLIAASSIGSTGKLKASGPGVPTVMPGELTHRAQGPDSDAKRAQAGGLPVGLIAAGLALSGTAHADRLGLLNDAEQPSFKARAFSARAPPAHA
jgi:hypothetical protein